MLRGMSAALIVVGIIVAGVGLFADTIGIGGAPGIGWKQLIAIIVGLVMILVGVAPMIQSFGPSASSLEER